MRTGTHRSCSRRRAELSSEFRVAGCSRSPGQGDTLRHHGAVGFLGPALGIRQSGAVTDGSVDGVGDGPMQGSPDTCSKEALMAEDPIEVVKEFFAT
jgi:hypothetical protein